LVVCPFCGNECKYLTVGKTAKVLGESEQYVRTQCREGKIPGAEKVDGLGDKGHWRIPATVVAIMAQQKGGTRGASETDGSYPPEA
jgi:hypothetical protein